MTTAIHLSERPAKEYPESDGLPIAENTIQFRWISTIMWGLDALFVHNPNVFVAGNLLWYPVEGAPTIRIGPDVLVALGRPRGDRRSYKQWEEANQAPRMIFEVLSPGNRPAEMDEKFKFYERYGVDEYYVYDPDDGSLRGWLRVGAHLKEIPGKKTTTRDSHDGIVEIVRRFSASWNMIERGCELREPIVIKCMVRAVAQQFEIRINHEINEIHEKKQHIQKTGGRRRGRANL